MLVILINVSVFCQSDENGSSISDEKLKELPLKSIEQTNVIPDIIVKYDSIRALTEINSSSQAEAYPWISSDGLRLYYTKSISSSINKIYYADRKSITDTFTNIIPISLNSDTSSVISCWLTNDELNIYYLVNKTGNTRNLYHATRNSLNDNFSNPIIVSLLGNVHGLLVGPSLTPDLGQLYIFSNNNNIYILNKISDNIYSLSDSLKFPTGYTIKPGQLTPGGLTFYLSLDSSKSDLIYFYKRNSILDKFNDVFYLKNNLINDTLFRNHQPSLSSSGNCLVFTRSTLNLWTSNDLFIAYNISGSSLIDQKLETTSVSIFPNPSTNIVNIKFDNYKDLNINYISIYSSTGKLIESFDVKEGVNQINISTRNYISGLYFCSMKTKNATINIGKFIVNNY